MLLGKSPILFDGSNDLFLDGHGKWQTGKDYIQSTTIPQNGLEILSLTPTETPFDV